MSKNRTEQPNIASSKIDVLEKDEISAFVVSEMEFVEVLEIGGNYYLHGAKILGDSYGEDVYLPVEVVRK